MCAEVLVKALPAVRGSEDESERISRDCFHKTQIRKLQSDNLDGSGKYRCPHRLTPLYIEF